MKFLSFILMLVLVVGCSSAPKKAPEKEITEDDLKSFNVGMKALEDEQYTEAAKIFDRLLTEKPATELDLITIYNSGAAYEGLGQCAKAAGRYRQVARGAIKKFPRLEVESLYRLSYAYECLGEDQKVVAALLDVYRRSGTMNPAVAKAEVPARLAAAYARLDNREQAKKFFAIADKGLKELRSETLTERQARTSLSKTLFFMGRMNSLDQQFAKRPADYAESLRTLQPFLMRSISADVQPWSDKSAEQLLAGYNKLLRLIEGTYVDSDAKDTGLNERLSREKRLSLIQYATQSLQELRTQKIPGRAAEDSLEARVFRELDGVEKRMQSMLASSSEVQMKTPEAQKREGLKRDGRIKDSKP